MVKASGLRSFVVILGSAALFAGCAHTRGLSKSQPNDQGAAQQPTPKSLTGVLQENTAPRPIETTAKGEIIIGGVKLENTNFDYPITINSRVEHWISYFEGRGRKYMEKYLERSEYFIPYIRPILRQNGMPEDLVYLAMIESGFNNNAKSRARAVGPWQFISATGKRYGLMVNWWVDERRDTRKATLAAVEYLKDLYNLFQNWELAAAAYNAGEAKVARAINRYGSRDFWTLTRHRFLRPETRDYVPKIIAAAIIAKNRKQFGFPEAVAHPGADEAIAGDGEIVKVEKEGAHPKEPTPIAQDAVGKVIAASSNSNGHDEYNDEYDDDESAESDDSQDSIVPATLTIPLENAPANGGQLANNESLPLAKPVPTPHVSKSGEVSGEQLAEFELQSPADLLKVSRAAGLSYQTIKALNPELLRWCTPPNVSSYRIKLPASAKDKFLATYNQTSFPRKVQFLSYKVRPGETLSRIASRFGIKVDPISDLNGVSSRMPLRKGLKVLLPMPDDRSRSLASLEVYDAPERHRRHQKRHHHAKGYKVTYKQRGAAKNKLVVDRES